MFIDLITALRFVSRQIIVLVIIAGLIYLIWPRIRHSGAFWLQPAASVAVTTGSAADVSPAAGGPVLIPITLAPEPLTLVAAQVTTATPEPLIENTPSVGTPRPTPVNQATADYLDALATADALIKGTATPPASRTVTPLIPAPTSTPTPNPTSITLVIVTETPTPGNIITVAAQAARATAVATTIGTYTPMPWNWVVPVVVTSEPATAIPANAATAAFQVAAATAAAFVYGTPTPTPINVWTATPTPFMRPVMGDVATPWRPPSPTPTPPPIPQELVGKIIFLSNRSGGPQPLPEPLVYVIDPDGGNLAVLNDDTFYRIALARDFYSADQGYRTFVKYVSRSLGAQGGFEPAQAIFIYDYQYSVEAQITSFGTGEAWDPVASPNQAQLAFVSDESGHAEIWVANRDGSGLRQLTKTNEAAFAREIGKNTFIPDDEHGHPSWSPDGSKLVFWANPNQHREIWVMNADGSNAYSLSTTGYDDWDPIWVKYTDPPREPVPGISGAPSSETPSIETSSQSNP